MRLVNRLPGTPFDELIAFPGPIDRFHENLELDPETNCWLWTGKRFSKNGYGRFYFQGREVAAHRFAYELHVGSIGRKHLLDHLCYKLDVCGIPFRRRHCCNPNHLEVVTQTENTRRGESFSGKNFRKTHCVRGHLLPRRNKRGKRECKICGHVRRKR